jgi:hypothetical protein
MKPIPLRIRVISCFIVFSLRHAVPAYWALALCLCAAGPAVGGARNNSAAEGDGIYCYLNRALRLLHCTIADNSSYGV